MQEIETRNCSIDIFRYICAVMVVAIHTSPFSDVNKELGYIFAQVVPRIAVPFFFATSGYFYVQKLEKGQTLFVSYIKRLLVIYFVWSCLYYIIDFVQWGYLNAKAYIFSCFLKFFITGSYYHFWFFPTIIFSVYFTTLMFKIRHNKALIPLSIILYIAGCLGCSYYGLGVNIPFLGKVYDFSQFELVRRMLLMGFPFFICGYLVYKIKDKIFSTITSRKLLIIWFAVVVIGLIEICVVHAFAWERNIVMSLSLYLLVMTTMLILLKNPLPQYILISKKSRVLANFTYYSHPFWIVCLSFFSSKVLHINLTETSLFILTIGFTYFIGLIVYKLDNKLINNFVK